MGICSVTYFQNICWKLRNSTHTSSCVKPGHVTQLGHIGRFYQQKRPIAVLDVSLINCVNLYGIFLMLICLFHNYSQGKGTGSGHRTLLYGNAILLRHQNSDMVSIPKFAWISFIFTCFHSWPTWLLSRPILSKYQYVCNFCSSIWHVCRQVHRMINYLSTSVCKLIRQVNTII